MKKGIIGAISLGIIFIVTVLCIIICTVRVPVGYVACVYSMNGGIQDYTLNQGWHVISPTKKIRLFTIGEEQFVLTKDKREGSKNDDSFRVSTSDDATIAISFQMSYLFDDSKIVDTFKRYKGMSGEDIIDRRVRTVMKSKVSEITTDYSLMDLYSGNRAEINSKITEYLNKEFNKSYGIIVKDASIIDVHPDKQLRKTINNRVDALQKKEQAKVEQETAKVEAETALIKAQNEAEIQITKAKAEAEANKVKAASITPELIQMKEAEARYIHGWVTVQGTDTVVTKDK